MKNFFDDEDDDDDLSSYDRDEEFDDQFCDKESDVNDIFESLVDDLSESQLEELYSKLSEYLSYSK
jgi:hypothetical protein